MPRETLRAALLVFAACGHSSSDDAADGSIGVIVDDAAGDAEVVSDGARDTAVDARVDGAVDAATDAAVDAPVDAAIDAPPVNPVSSLSFAAPVYYASGYKPYFVRSGDLDGDGDLDLVVGNEQASAVAVFRNAGGSFVRVAEFPTGVYPTGAALVDLDRDGWLDVITADYRGDSVSVLRGRGDATLFMATSYPTVPGGETSNVAAGDIDGDAIADVIATNPQRASASVFLGQANGTLIVAQTIVLGTPGSAEPYSVAIGDFDRDGRNDAAIADDRLGRVRVYLGNGDGTFTVGTTPAIGGVRSHILLAHDMDRDGNLDVVVANRNSDDVSVLRGNGNGTFRTAIVTSTGFNTGPYSLAIADFNLDGNPDVATANFMTSSMSVLVGRGDGTFSAVVSGGVIGGTSYGIAAGDFDGDGKPDLAIANATSNNIAIVRNTSE
ncbi:MAG: VCBS repeat-containing protein [Kofleriaceae bacterium]|nr:VCBS repeat-containing protein [Kofleriaceae bacterium]